MINNLEKRTTEFGKLTIKICKKTRINLFNKNAISQIIRSSTSIGANYREANNASSKKDFKNKIFLCKKETSETKHWIEILASSNNFDVEDLRILFREAQELIMIFQKIINSINKNGNT